MSQHNKANVSHLLLSVNYDILPTKGGIVRTLYRRVPTGTSLGFKGLAANPWSEKNDSPLGD